MRNKKIQIALMAMLSAGVVAPTFAGDKSKNEPVKNTEKKDTEKKDTEKDDNKKINPAPAPTPVPPSSPAPALDPVPLLPSDPLGLINQNLNTQDVPESPALVGPVVSVANQPNDNHVPEPASLVLIGLGLAAMRFRSRKS